MAGAAGQQEAAAAIAAAAASHSIRPKPIGFFIDRLWMHVWKTRSNPVEFLILCIFLAEGIDYAVANSDIPPRARELPSLLKKIYNPKNEPQLQAAFMVLMISVKNACKNGWFLSQDGDELLTLANEMARSFCSPEGINIEPSSLPQVISNVMSRFFPRMKLGNVLTSLEVKPGFGAFAVDFHIMKDKAYVPQEKIRLVVIQTDCILMSSCLISPPKVNFLLNGKGVDRRTDFAMDTGPQLPTNVTSMLKYGTNLLQAIGQFSGNYIIAIAFMTAITSFDVPTLQEYVPPVAAELESDSEIIEGSSRISLNCPISFTRIKTPVKGQLCRHHQCFDFQNYVEINSRRPSWRCPHCNQSVCYLDIRIDQYMVKILSEVAGNVADVLVSADGSWTPVMESDDKKDEHNDMTPRPDHDGSENCESTRSLNMQTSIVDLTMEDAEENDAMGTCENEDRKPSKDLPPGHSVNGSPVSSIIKTTLEAPQNNFPQIEDDFWSGIYFPGSAAPGASESPATYLRMTPVLTDAVTPAFNREIVDVRGDSQPTASIMQTQTFAPSNLQMQQPSLVGNSIITTDFGRQIPRFIERNPIAIQALPAPGQSPAPHTSHHRLRANFNSVLPNVSPVTSQTPPMMPSAALDMPSSSMLHYPMTQNLDHQGFAYVQNQYQQIVGLPATSQGSANYRGSHNAHHPTTNHGMPQSLSQLPSAQTSTHHLPTQAQQGAVRGSSGQEAGATNSHGRPLASGHRSTQVARSPPAVPVQLQAPRTGPSFPVNAERLRTSVGEQRGMNMGSVSRVDAMNELPAEQNWRPTGRMRGSLSGRAYSAALSQFLIQPTPSGQAPTPTPDQSSSPLDVQSQLQALIGNNINAHGSAQQAYTRAGDTPASPGTRQ